MPRHAPFRAPPPHNHAFRQGSDDPTLGPVYSAEASPEYEPQRPTLRPSFDQPEFGEDDVEHINPSILEDDAPHANRWDRRLRRRVNSWLPYTGTRSSYEQQEATWETPANTAVLRTRLTAPDDQLEHSNDPGTALDHDMLLINRLSGFDEAAMTEAPQDVVEASANEHITAEPMPPRPALLRLVQPESSRKASKKISEIKCSGCPKVIVGDDRYIKKHVATHGIKVECKAPGCKRRFPYPCRLERHMNCEHRDRRQYRCNICAACFNRPDDINTHLKRSHHKVKNAEQGSDHVNIICALCESNSSKPMWWSWGSEDSSKHVKTQHPI